VEESHRAVGRRVDPQAEQEDRVTRKLVVYELLSLDGVAEGPDAYITEFDDVMEDNLGRVIATQDTVLLGRRTYDDWAVFWPTSDVEPFASFINAVDKFVATSRPVEEPWSNTTVIDGDLVEQVTELKSRSGADIGVHGSIEVAQALLEGDLVDELRLVVAPALQEHGRKLFDRGLSRRLTLTRNATSPSGYLLLDFHVNQKLA
jgi:dihydrofolate reductase